MDFASLLGILPTQIVTQLGNSKQCDVRYLQNKNGRFFRLDTPQQALGRYGAIRGIMKKGVVGLVELCKLNQNGGRW